MYRNGGWDLVDADAEGTLDKVSKDQLPDSLKNKTTAELKEIVATKARERAAIQQQIATTNTQRDNYIVAEKARNTANNNNAPTLESEVEKIIREQVKRYNMQVQ